MIQFFKKNFEKWLEIKPIIHEKTKFPLYIHERDVFWYHCGENIGMEICGKGKDFFRPCIIHTVLSKHHVLIIPLSTNIKEGNWYVLINSLEKKSVACLHQVISIDVRRLHRKLGEISLEDMNSVQKSFEKLYIKINPQGATSGDPKTLKELKE